MNIKLLLKYIENSLLHLVKENHLNNMLKLINDKSYVYNIFELIIKIGEKLKTCKNFDIQNIKLINFMKKQ